jgi:hypothetical protein
MNTSVIIAMLSLKICLNCFWKYFSSLNVTIYVIYILRISEFEKLQENLCHYIVTTSQHIKDTSFVQYNTSRTTQTHSISRIFRRFRSHMDIVKFIKSLTQDKKPETTTTYYASPHQETSITFHITTTRMWSTLRCWTSKVLQLVVVLDLQPGGISNLRQKNIVMSPKELGS